MTTLYCAIIVAGFMATASLADINPRRMQRDIRIMEGVLGNLYLDTPDPTSSSARGLYLDGYGVLFLIQGSRPMQAHPSIEAALDEKGVKSIELKSGDPASDEKSLAENHDLLAEFLGTYAGTIGQLDPDDRIEVCYQRRHASGLAGLTQRFTDGITLFSVDSTSFDLTKQIEAIIPMAIPFENFALTFGDSVSFFDPDEQVAAITRLRKRLEEAAAEAGGEVKVTVEVVGDSLRADVVEADKPSHGSIVARLHGIGGSILPPSHVAATAPLITATAKKSAIDAFREGRIDSATFRQRIAFSERSASKKIDIMAGILDQVLGRDHYPLISSQRTWGMYQPALGALFLIRDSVFHSISPPLHAVKADIVEAVAVKADIVEAVADYGATLGQVQPDEHVIVEYRSPFSTRSALLKVPKSAIDTYARGDLDLDAFREKAVWETR